MKIRRHMHPDHIPALARQHRGNGIPANSHRPTREKMGREYLKIVTEKSEKTGALLPYATPAWGKVYNHNGEEINPIAIQARIDERTSMTSWVKPGKATTITLGKRLFLTVDDRGKQPSVFLHTSEDLTHTQRFPKGIRVLPNLKAARRYARELLDAQKAA